MSVYFHSDIKNEKKWVLDTPCMCAQNADEFALAVKKVTPKLPPARPEPDANKALDMAEEWLREERMTDE